MVRRFRRRTAVAALGVAIGVGCGEETPARTPGGPTPTKEEVPAPAAKRELAAGIWRFELASPGGPLPIRVVLSRAGKAGWRAVANNGPEEVEFDVVELGDRKLRLRLDVYDSEMNLDVSEDGREVTGTWSKTIPSGKSTLPVKGAHGKKQRFEADGGPPPADAPDFAALPKAWDVVFTDDGGTEPARLELKMHGQEVLGTFLTPTGDYRYLAGAYEGGRLRLSCFDGGHVFLFDAKVTKGEGGTLQISGDFWSRDTYHATWKGAPASDDGGRDLGLGDPWAMVSLTNEDGKFGFSFPAVSGVDESLLNKPLSHEDPRFAGRVVLVDIFGSWCPNCNDQAPLLAKWHRKWNRQGLEVVGLGFEMTGDEKRDAEQLRAFAKKHRVEYPLLLAGLSDKKKAGANVTDLSAVKSYPTSIFIDRTGKVRRIYSGFAGPATGEHHTKMVAEHEKLLQELLAEPRP